MNIDKEILRLVDEIRQRGKSIRWLRRNRQKLDQVPDSAYFSNGYLDIDHPEHSTTIKLIKAIGGKFKKEPGHVPNSISYTGELDGVQVRAWSGKPPPSCRIIEVEEYVPEVTIPASVRKVKKMVCHPEFPAVLAMAAAKAQPDPIPAPQTPT